MGEGEGGERHAEAALDAGGAVVAVNDAAGRDLRVGDRLAHGAHPRRRDMAGLQEFLQEAELSAGITEDETAFLKSLSPDGKRPSLLYYYRELQNLRDPLNFLPSSIEKRRERRRKTSVIKSPARRKRPGSRSVRQT